MNDIKTHGCHAATMGVGAVARRSGLSVSSLHFYEREGLIRSTRNSANHRMYSRATLRVLAVVKAGVEAGIPLAEIRRALGPALEGQPISRAHWDRIVAGWRADLQARIERLTVIRDRLTGCIGCGCLSLDCCAAVNPGDKAADIGPGAHAFRDCGAARDRLATQAAAD
ncbi:redox-sensitive transcriptional activator SoxR [Paracoccus sp. TK19116]|uniref:Redox-sensitive transcriptional activator SoxR n=1 Tax=Paracoccus albicereus TaxID=2922394 RepID=A0ABT1MRB0_9RHOB|nr:redox-sensitive transcriptional activator SoxR [Paracoccus albicereus]MCQ0970850.1 redox-sensitive transcriptional activator SoxR [Paracoccus albicereus]